MRGISKFGSLVRAIAPPVEVYPSGTRLIFDQEEPPTGWTRDTVATLDDRLLRIVVGTRTPNGGSWAISGLSGESHQHGLPSVVAHSHSASFGAHTHTVKVISIGVAYVWLYGYPYAAQYERTTSSQGISVTLSDSGVATPKTNLASYTISSDGTWRPLFRGAIIAQKD